jgi:hypothetical protein
MSRHLACALVAALWMTGCHPAGPSDDVISLRLLPNGGTLGYELVYQGFRTPPRSDLFPNLEWTAIVSPTVDDDDLWVSLRLKTGFTVCFANDMEVGPVQAGHVYRVEGVATNWYPATTDCGAAAGAATVQTDSAVVVLLDGPPYAQPDRPILTRRFDVAFRFEVRQ